MAYGFDKQSTQRISKVVRHVERSIRGSTVPRPVKGREILSQGTKMVMGLLTADLDTTDSTFTIDNVEAVVGSLPSEITGTSDTLTIQNTFDWEGDDNGVCIAVYQASTELWLPLQVECPA